MKEIIRGPRIGNSRRNTLGKKKNNKSEKLSPSSIFASFVSPGPAKDEAALEMEQTLIDGKRIIGGEQAAKNSWPWMVYITISSKSGIRQIRTTVIWLLLFL